MSLNNAIRGVVNQECGVFEIIVVDDGSKNKLESIISKDWPDYNLKVITNSKNVGYTQSLINGIQTAKGEFIAICDADDVWMPKKLKVQINILETNTNIGAVGSGCIVNSSGVKTVKYYPQYHKQLYSNLVSMNKFPPHSSFVIRKRTYNLSGGYDPSVKYAQDHDLLLRIGMISQLYCVPDAVVEIGRSRAQISQTKEIDQLQFKMISISNQFAPYSEFHNALLNQDSPCSIFIILKPIIKYFKKFEEKLSNHQRDLLVRVRMLVLVLMLSKFLKMSLICVKLSRAIRFRIKRTIYVGSIYISKKNICQKISLKQTHILDKGLIITVNKCENSNN